LIFAFTPEARSQLRAIDQATALPILESIHQFGAFGAGADTDPDELRSLIDNTVREVRAERRANSVFARLSSQWQPHQPVFPLRCFRCQPDEQEFVDCGPNVEALRDEEYT
jgi:hypothetical protein